MEGPYYGHGLEVHPSDPHRELMGSDPEGSRSPREVQPYMARKREQEESHCGGGANAHCPPQSMCDTGHALFSRSGPVKTSSEKVRS